MLSDEQKVYMVTLKSYDDLENFYQDMETEGGALYIPNRCIKCVDRGPDSRVTRYMLTAEEAALVAQDPRVEAVELNYGDSGIEIVPMGAPITQSSSNWDKSEKVNASMLNWGLVRCVNGRPNLTATVYPKFFGNDVDTATAIPNMSESDGFLQFNKLRLARRIGTTSNFTLDPGYWDMKGITYQSGDSWGNYADTGYYNESITADLRLNSTGKHVDVVIIDGGHIDPNHPEFARNPDGTGGTRWVNYNWFQHNEELGKGANGTYNYNYWGINSHHMHCTGTVAGITQGWAKEANIYTITYNCEDFIRYVRAFHNSKPINPVTGRRNPTITNNSFGTMRGGGFAKSRISQVVYSGTTYNRPSGGFTDQQLINWGIIDYSRIYTRSTSMEADYAAAMADGVVCVFAAGNNSWRNEEESTPEFNNNLTLDGFTSGAIPNGTWFYMRGTSPGAIDFPGRICVGALDTFPWDSKVPFSSTGTKVDLYAPGVAVMSSYTNEVNVTNAVPDSRNSNYFLQKLQGTSMASPQVCGIVACLAEHMPHWKGYQFKEYLLATCENNTITDGVYKWDSYWRFAKIFGYNRIAKFQKQRVDTGVTWPKYNYYAGNEGSRKTWPRMKNIYK